MTRDEIMRMAYEAWGDLAATMHEGPIEKFASLVAAAERKECERIVESSSDKHQCAAAIQARGKV